MTGGLKDDNARVLGDAYNYLGAENGNQAIQMIGENIGIDLMLLDMQQLHFHHLHMNRK
ncbi:MULTISPECIES: hypothetical protein [Blautia]